MLWFNCKVQTSQIFVIVVQLLSHIQLFVTPWTAAHQASLSFTIFLRVCSKSCPLSQMLMPSNHFILCLPLLLLSSTFPTIRIFSNQSVLCIGWPNYWSFRFSISPSSEYSGLISFRTDCFDLLAVQGTPKSLLRHHDFYFVQMSSDIVNLPWSSVWPQWKNRFTP